MNFSDLVYVDDTGYHYADYPTMLEWLQEKYRTIYGLDVYLEPDSQDGQFLAILAQSFYDMAAAGAAIYNSFSPSTAQGVGLARVVKINGIAKLIATNSSVDLAIGGTSGTTIVDGIAEDTLGQKWLLPSPTVIPPGGTIIVTATAQEKGAIEAAPGTITKIFTPTLGWQTVNNVDAATPGAPVESDAALRVRQSQSVAIPSLSVFEGTVGAVKAVEGVIRCEGYENDTGSVDSDGISAHSIAIVVEGGDVDEIAEAIALHKTPGTGTFGDVDVVVFDKYGVPNTIHFSRPDEVDIKAALEIETYDGFLTEYLEQIKASIAAYINSLKIGQDVLYTKIFVPANLVSNPEASKTFNITSLEIAKLSDPLATDDITIDFDEVAACDVANINIVVV